MKKKVSFYETTIAKKFFLNLNFSLLFLLPYCLETCVSCLTNSVTQKFTSLGKKKNTISPPKILVLLSASVERFCVSRMRDFYVSFYAFFVLAFSTFEVKLTNFFTMQNPLFQCLHALVTSALFSFIVISLKVSAVIPDSSKLLLNCMKWLIYSFLFYFGFYIKCQCVPPFYICILLMSTASPKMKTI